MGRIGTAQNACFHEHCAGRQTKTEPIDCVALRCMSVLPVCRPLSAHMTMVMGMALSGPAPSLTSPRPTATGSLASDRLTLMQTHGRGADHADHARII